MKLKNIMMMALGLLVTSSVSMLALAEDKQTEFFVEDLSKEELNPEMATTFELPSLPTLVTDENSNSINYLVGENRAQTEDGRLVATQRLFSIPYGLVYDRYNTNELEPYLRKALTVTYDGKVVDDYKIYYIDTYGTSEYRITNQSSHALSYTIDYASTSLNMIRFLEDTNYNVTNGDTILMTDSSSNYAGALTFHNPNDSYSSFEMSFNPILGDIGNQISPSYGDDVFLKIDHARYRDNTDIENVSEVTWDTRIQAKGTDIKRDVYNQWSTSAMNRKRVEQGDVIRIWHADNKITKQGGLTQDVYYDKNNYAYYEITRDGLQPYTRPSLKVVNRMVALGATNAELTDNIADSFEEVPSSGYEILGFTSYPDTKKLGSTRGKIKVKEEFDYLPGVYAEIIYDAPFTVVEEIKPSLEVETKPLTLPVGTKQEYISPNDYIEAVYDGETGEEMDPSDYTVEFVDGYDEDGDLVAFNFMAVNTYDVKIKVTEKADAKNTVTTTEKTNVLFGDTIVAYTASLSGETEANISLLNDKDDTPYIVANEGNKLTGSKSFTYSPVITLYRNDTKNSLVELNKDRRFSPLHSIYYWNNEDLNTVDLKYGDVLGQSITDKTFGDKTTSRTAVSRDETLVQEVPTESLFTDIYYELTRDGYRLLHLNQFISNETLVFGLREDVDSYTDKELESLFEKAFEYPEAINNGDKKNFRIEYVKGSIDTSKEGSHQGAEFKVYEKLESGGEFMTTYTQDYEVEERVTLSLKENTLPVGTKESEINPYDYIASVKNAGVELRPDQYTAEFLSPVDTSIVGSNPTTKISVTVKETNSKVEGLGKTNIIWGSSIVSKSEVDGTTDSVISLLNVNQKPYLLATQGTGLAVGDIRSRPNAYVYRNSTANQILESGSGSVNNHTATQLMHDRNEAFKNQDLQYGDVFGYEVFKYSVALANYKGANTWISRDEKLVTETEGYDRAYYELTPNGYRLLHLNQFTVNDKMPIFNLNDGKESSNVPPEELIDFPEGINIQSNYRFEYGDIDTTKSGQKEGTVKVYEKLESGGEFMTTYPIAYQVNYQVTEKHFDEVGKELKDTKKVTNVELGKTHQVTPAGSVTVDGTLYLYQGWLASNKTPGKDTPTAGNPPSVKDTTTYQYVYKKADSMINMTIPTSLIFGTDNETGSIDSDSYQIKNNSKEVGTEVSLGSFNKVTSNVSLLKATDKDPTKVENKARINLKVNDQETISSITETTKDTFVTQLAPNGNASIGWSGHYFGDLTKSNVVEYQMVFKFKATEK